MKLKLDHHLKGDSISALARHTHAGQAYFAGTGPDGKTCRECALWNMNGYKKTDKLLKKGSCEKGTGVVFDHDAFACKYFSQNQNPPAAKLKEVA